MLRKLLFVAALASVALPVAAQPHGEPPEGGPRHHRLFISPSGEAFRGRGGLDAWFAQADANQDGAVTAAEFAADAAKAFALFDTNGDGVIDGLEVQAYERDRVPEIAEIGFGGGGGGREEGGWGGGGGGGMRSGGTHRHGGRGHRGDYGGEHASKTEQDVFFGAGQNGAARYSLLNEPEPLLAADADIDGKITRAEWDRRTAARFVLLDKAKTGKLTLADLKARSSKR